MRNASSGGPAFGDFARLDRHRARRRRLRVILTSQRLDLGDGVGWTSGRRGSARPTSSSSTSATMSMAATPALHVAAAAFRRPVAELLIGHGADVRARNRRGAEPLHYAADANHSDPAAQAATIAVLSRRSVRIRTPSIARASQLCTAPFEPARLRRCGRMLDAGADPRQPNRAGSTPLHLAVQPTGRGGSGSDGAHQQQVAILRLLLERGAKLTDRDGKGKDVLRGGNRAIRSAGVLDAPPARISRSMQELEGLSASSSPPSCSRPPRGASARRIRYFWRSAARSSRSCRARRRSPSRPSSPWRCSSRRCCSTRRTTRRREISRTTGCRSPAWSCSRWA